MIFPDLEACSEPGVDDGALGPEARAERQAPIFAGKSAKMALSGYRFESLRADEIATLYRGRRADDTSILLLQLESEYPAIETLKSLEHEYSLREHLELEWAARPLALVEYGERAALVMDDPGGIPLDRLLRQALDLGAVLRFAVSLASALDRLHKNGIIHKDVKPAHVLADPRAGTCWLTGFRIASRLPRERQSASPPEFLAGSLAYMAPEQTGRMNRSVDSRSDLYSLGATLYEMLTGTLPFNASEPIEWVHCHLAKQPVPPHQRVTSLPPALSDLVMKLLAKAAEDRYQTAAGAESDLRHCLQEWESQGWIEPFLLGRHDTAERPSIPEKLYGRADAIDCLLRSFDRVVASGRPELAIVTGYSGIGKSSVVNELHKVLVQPRGLFASGKFDQHKRDIPYSTLAQAFRGLIRPLLGLPEAELTRWRALMLEALGVNGQLMIDLVPELELIIGEQPPTVELPPQDAQTRFQFVFARFIGVFARPEHPLALFLDDLQWLDAATLDLLAELLIRDDVRHLMLIGAYRSNEVTASHPLVRRVEAIRSSGATVHEVSLGPLSRADLEQLVADFLHSTPACVGPLAQLLHEKTAGNPFFATQFCHALFDEELITFDHSSARWSWDLSRIRSKGYTDNVADLMVSKLSRLPGPALAALKELACLGNSADAATLSIVHCSSQSQLHDDLWSAVRQELVLRAGDSYRFVHDRIQEAAYSLIPSGDTASVHLRLGRLLLGHVAESERDDSIFEIVNQLNRAEPLLSSREERERVAELNLAAGNRAKASAAYASACKYFEVGCRLLDEASRQRQTELAFSLELNRAESELMTGALSAADEHLIALAARADDAVHRARVACLHVDVCAALSRSDRAVAVCLDYLALRGVCWSAHPSAEDGAREYQRFSATLAGRPIDALLDLPLMTDAESLATMDVLTKVLPAAVFTDARLLSLAAGYAVNLSLERGNCDGSCVAYLFFGMISGPHFGNYEAGFELGRLGYELVEKRGLKRFQARTYLWFAEFVIPWTRHIRQCLDLARRAFVVACDSCDLTIANYCCKFLNTCLLATGDPLEAVEREAEHGLGFAERARFGFVIDCILGQLGLIYSLRGTTKRFGHLDRGSFEEAAFERHLASQPSLALPEFRYWTRKLQARLFARQYDEALRAAAEAKRLLWTSPSLFEAAEYTFYSALCLAAVCDSAPEGERASLLEALGEQLATLDVWAQHCPENFESRARLVAAEAARLDGRPLDAEQLYERAIRSARDNGLVQNEALASELAGGFYAGRGLERIALAYLRDARHCYLRWGADAKVRQLDELYPRIRQEDRAPPPTHALEIPLEHLDLVAIIKASQAVSSEIVLQSLLHTLMRSVLEHAGAERGLLIVPRGHEHYIEAEATTHADAIHVSLAQAHVRTRRAPESIIQYVIRSQESVILHDSGARSSFSDDAYLAEHRVRSLLCMPLINQGKLVAALYLENNLTAHVFTPTRIAVLKLLASQAAVSLENARLYRDLLQREAKIRRLVDANIMGIFIFHLRGDIFEANDAFLRIVGRTRAELGAGLLSWRSLPPQEGQARELELVATLAATGSLTPHEKEYLRADGSRIPVLVGAAMFDGSDDEGVAFVLDLTEQKRALEALRNSEAQLTEANAELAHVTRVTTLGELTASIAHEINQPLTAIVSNAAASLRWINRDFPDLEEATTALQRIMRDARRAGDVISRMRLLFKKATTATEPVDLNAAIEEVVLFTNGEAQRHRIAVHLELERGLPLVRADRVQLQQVILNLVVNAIEALSASGEAARNIWLASRPVSEVQDQRPERDADTNASASGRWLLVEVRDSGPGLGQEQLGQIFNAFYTTKSQGLGMGLAICRSIVQAHGGQLWVVAGAASAGATFRFTLPIAEADVEPSSNDADRGTLLGSTRLAPVAAALTNP